MNTRHHNVSVATIPPGIRAAFTLIEVMLALAIAAMVLTAIGSVFFSALKLRARSTESLESSLPIERALQLISRDLKNAVPPGGYLSGPLQSGVVNARVSSDEGIQIFTSTGRITERDPWPDIQKVSYQLQPPENRAVEGMDLVRSVTRNLLPTVNEEFEDQILLHGVESLEFTYFDGMHWYETWDSILQTNLPYAVRIQVSLARDRSPDHRPIEMVIPISTRILTNAVILTGEEEEAADETP